MQINLNFEAGLIERFPSFRDVVSASVYGCGRPFKVVAAALDMSSSELSRKLGNNPNDPVNFPLHLLPDLIAATGDITPVHWLIERFCDSQETKKQRSIDELSSLLPKIHALLASAAVPNSNSQNGSNPNNGAAFEVVRKK